MVAVIGIVCSFLAACGGSSGSASGQAASATATFPINRTSSASSVQISGTPSKSVIAGHSYSFQPTVSTAASGAVTKFSVANAPAWAKFSATTGQLSGTPSASQVGTYKSITISVTAGTSSATLAPFDIAVSEPNSKANVALSWVAPTENADGSPLVDLKGYKVYYGPTSRAYSDTVEVKNPGLTTYVVENLQAGRYFFAVTSYNAKGQESTLSGEVTTLVD